MSEAPRHAVACSCGRSWSGLTQAEADKIGREHDDSPMAQHIVSSPTAWRAARDPHFLERAWSARVDPERP